MNFYALIAVLLSFSDIIICTRVPKIRPVPNLIESDGYPVEVHHVKTDDGYLIELHRIPQTKKSASNGATVQPGSGRVVLMPHCLLCNSAVYVVLGPGKALSYLLHDSGYDVWMMNARGTSYSLNHTQYSPRDPKFWDFSFHEMGVQDLVKSMDYVLEETGESSADLIAFSMGTTMSFVALAEQPDFRSKVRRMAALAPVAYISYVDLLMVNLFELFFGKYSVRKNFLEFPPKDWNLNRAIYLFCHKKSLFKAAICPDIINLVIGAQSMQTDVKNLDFYFLYTPDSTSTRLGNHYLQIRRSGVFGHYNYGPKANQWHYGSWEPPVYNLSQIDVPIAFYSSKWDTLSTAKDVERLESELPNVVSHYKIPLYEFSHLDFIWGANVHKEVYSKILDFLFS